MILDYIPTQTAKAAFIVGSIGAVTGVVSCPFICSWEAIQKIAFHAMFHNLSANWDNIGQRAATCLVQVPMCSIIAFGGIGAVVGLACDTYLLAQHVFKKFV